VHAVQPVLLQVEHFNPGLQVQANELGVVTKFEFTHEVQPVSEQTLH
jgi:hypothetical protein